VPVYVIAKIKQQNNQSFKLIEVADLEPDQDVDGYVLTGDGAGNVGMEPASGHGVHHQDANSVTEHQGKVGETEMAIVIPIQKPLPAGSTAQAAAVPIPAPFAFTAKRLKAQARSALSAQADFVVKIGANTFGTVSIAASASGGTADPADLSVNEGDLIDVDMGTNSGQDDIAVIVMIVGERDVEASIA